MLRELPLTNADPDTPLFTAGEKRAMARAVLELFARWKLADSVAREILGGLPPRTYARWKTGEPGRIDRDLATRLSLLIGIHKGLRYLFSDPKRGYAWVNSPNDVFSGRTPVAVMAEGDIFSLQRVRSYLDAERGAW